MSRDTVTAKIAAVTYDTRGDTLAADVAIGDTTITVGDLGDFDEAGGVLLLGDDPGVGLVGYAPIPDEAVDTLTIGPAPVAVEAGDPVRVWNTVTNAVERSVQLWALLDDAEDGDALPAAVSEGVEDRLDTELNRNVGLSVELEVDEFGSLTATQLLGGRPEANRVKADQDTAIATGPGSVTVLLKYLPITNSEHLYWNGQYRSGFKWSREGYVVTVFDPDSVVVPGDVFWVEYLYTDPTPRPARDPETVIVDVPGTVRSFSHAGGPGTLVGGADALLIDDGDGSYVEAGEDAVTGGTAGYQLEVTFPATLIPGALSTTELVVTSKGPDSRTATAGQAFPSLGLSVLIDQRAADGTYIDSGFWRPVITETTDGTYAETVTALQQPPGVEFITKAMIEGGRVEYLHGDGINFTEGVTGTSGTPSVPYRLRISYVALRITYVIPGYPAYDGLEDDFSVDDGSHDPLIRLAQVQAGGGTGGGGSASTALVPLTGLAADGTPGLVFDDNGQLVMTEVSL